MMVCWLAGFRPRHLRRRAQRQGFRFPSAARSTGCKPARLVWRHVAPNLRPLFYAQFFISIPLFILTEANLSILGLGVMEPMPSWGNLLRGFEDFSTLSANPWRLVPLVLLVMWSCAFNLFFRSRRLRSDTPRFLVSLSTITMCGPAFVAAQSTAKSGGELHFCLHGEPKTFNPLLVEDGQSEIVRYLTGAS